jgi:four helix bundle protein
MSGHQRPYSIRERSFAFAVEIVKLYQRLDQRGGAGKALARQLLASSTSIGANLEEADAGQSRADFISKCNIALKEARETHYWLRLLQASTLTPETQTAPLLEESNEIIAILTTIIKNSKIAH